MTSVPDYVELRCRSAFSFLAGASLPEDLVERAAALGYDTLALADARGVYGAPRRGAARGRGRRREPDALEAPLRLPPRGRRPPPRRARGGAARAPPGRPGRRAPRARGRDQRRAPRRARGPAAPRRPHLHPP